MDDLDDDERDYDYSDMDDERESNRGTSMCDSLCDPMCNWCLVSHSCPDDCGGGGDCPYAALATPAGDAP